MEWFIVMPRYHHIHHSSNPDHYNLNLGNNFTFWDRLFGTYLDPDTLERSKMVFGIGEKPNPMRLIAGLRTAFATRKIAQNGDSGAPVRGPAAAHPDGQGEADPENRTRG